MRIFILEDCFDIRGSFLTKGMPKDAEIILASDYDTAIKMLVEDNFDAYMFDHDLGFASTKNGSDVSRFMKEKGLGKNKPFVFHSTNPVGIDAMVSDLTSYGRILIIAPINVVRRMTPTSSYWSMIAEYVGK